MPAVKTKRISTLIESQLPEFISSEYELFSKFVQKYYEAQEVQGGTLDIINNIQKYADIDYYEKNLLKQSDTLSISVGESDTTIVVNDASSFPQKNGYIRINNEIIFYTSRTDTEFENCYRGVSGNTTLGDLYTASNFESTEVDSHTAGSAVYNVSNLFLYALVKNFESQYLGSFPEKYLRGEVDKRTLIKNISKFYKAKGTDSSIKFIFNTIVARDADNKPSVYNPKDFTYKASKADWVNVYALKVKVVSGNPEDLIGTKIVQSPTSEYDYASATVDNVQIEGTIDNEVIWNIILAPETVNGEFAISTKTRLEADLSSSSSTGDRVDVFSTIGWTPSGEILVGEEIITFSDKTVNQFIIENRTSPLNHQSGEFVYKPVIIENTSASLLTLGVSYNISTKDESPYSFPGDSIQISNPGFETSNPKIVEFGTNDTRWFLNQGSPIDAPTNTSVETALDQVKTDVSAIFEDDDYYYIASSSFPSYKIFDGSIITDQVKDQKLLKLIRKESIRTTEIYKTPKRDVGILVNGVPLYGNKDEESIRYGTLEEIRLTNKGRGYKNPPFVLVDGLANKARAILTGEVIDRIVVDTEDTFIEDPTILITSGYDAEASAIVTNGEITSIVVDNPGKYYSTPPIVQITDASGRGRFAEYNSVVNTNGEIVEFEKISGGSFYTQGNVIVRIIPVGGDGNAIPFLKEWNFNRFEKYKSKLDSNYGYLFDNYNRLLDNGYAHYANPKSLRIILGDNLSTSEVVPPVLTHSPILGFAYDGNPIYGPYGYDNPLNSTSSIARMTSSYSLNGSRTGGPPRSTYPLGSFTNDYTYVPNSGSLDRNNGRYCVTPEFPGGTYAYFITIDASQNPVFPYILGENFYSLPVDSNYNSDINQNDIPRTSKRYFVAGMPGNGDGVLANVNTVRSGSIETVSVDSSSDNFSVNSKFYFENSGTEGFDAEAIVSSVNGKNVNYLESKEDKVVRLTTIQNAYLFEDDILRQPSSNASGQIVGTVKNDNIIVLKDVVGSFDNTGTFSADIKTFNLLLDQDSSYTEGAILSLSDGQNPPIATGEVLESTQRQNVVIIKLLSGTWIVDDDYFIQSSNLFNTSGSKITTISSLSDNLEPFDVNQNVALIETDSPHGLGVGDIVNVDIIPDDAKTKTYYVRKRLYQTVKFRAPEVSTKIDFTGVGRFQILNGGADYTEGTYNNIPLTGGSGEGATAIITVSSAGIVSSVVLQEGGSGYAKGDILSVDDASLQRSGGSLGFARLAIYVDHVGVSVDSTLIPLASANNIADGDLLKIGEEIVQVGSIVGSNVNVTRAVENTTAVDHYNNQPVTLYKAQYNFTSNYMISNAVGAGTIKSYDPETQEAVIIYGYLINPLSAEKVQTTTNFFDVSTPSPRLVSVREVGDLEYKFEISEDNISFVVNPLIEVQEFYRYIFDTSHVSMNGVNFDVSPSNLFNLETVEKIETSTQIDLKFGYGPRLETNDYQTKLGTDFTNFYYFDKNGVVSSDNQYLRLITDPLQGRKTVSYVTSNRFVYDLNAIPLWDGSGTITYTTTGQFAVGSINTVQITNSGFNYKKVPTVTGVSTSNSTEANVSVIYDNLLNKLDSIVITDPGSGYSNPIVVVTDGDGSGAKFEATQNNGELFSIVITNPGEGYTYPPSIKVIEGDVQAYAGGNDIGVPVSISIIQNGGSFHLDETVASTFTSKYTATLKDFSGIFNSGETVVQYVGTEEVLRAKVSEFRSGSNLIKLEKIQGVIREGVVITGLVSGASGTVTGVFVTTFDNSITSFYDNLGYYTSDRGLLGVSNQKLTDSFFYQDYSYVIKSKTSIEQWRELIKSTTHPAGFKLFGQVDVKSTASAVVPGTLPENLNKVDHFSIIQLWDPEKNKITVDDTRLVVTQNIEKLENYRLKNGIGSASTSEFDFNRYRAFHFTLSDPFDGYYDTDGILQGTTTFQLRDENNLPFFPPNAKHLFITLDGVLQEPEVAYTVSGSNITFAQPPLGDNSKLTGNNLSELSEYEGVEFYGRYFKFKLDESNNKYFKKIRNIFQRSGRWLDAANQIERNKTFIIEETIGYGEATQTSIDWSTKLNDYIEIIRYLLEAYEHDIRFGGNVKSYDLASTLITDDEYYYFDQNLAESINLIEYATNLVKLAIVNWNNVQYIGTYTSEDSYINSNIIVDPSNPVCADVTSSVDSLFANVEDVLNQNEVDRTLPDYVDGETRVFELYWDDSTEVITEEDEDLFISINAVLQRPKYNAEYPGSDSYYIDRSVSPNTIVFDVAPIWDQDFGAKTIGEPTAVEKVTGIGVGNYKRLTIDKNLVDGVKTGPFLILDVEDGRVQNIEDDEFVYVFLDGVLQRRDYSYTIVGPNIYFKFPVQKEMNVDMRLLYGQTLEQTLKLYDFSVDTYYARAKGTVDITSGLLNLYAYDWMGDFKHEPLHGYQILDDGTYNVLGELSNIRYVGNQMQFDVFGFECELDVTRDLYFAVKGRYNLNTTVTFSDYSLVYERDDDGRIITETYEVWRGTSLSKSYRNPFLSLSNGDLIKLEGESDFRRVKQLPRKALTREQRPNNQVSNTQVASVNVGLYNGVTVGEGLSVVAIMETDGNGDLTGRVDRLEWNQRSFDPVTQPTAYQYYTPPVLNFVPTNGDGGGARGTVLVSGGQVVSVDLTDKGSGYTEAPRIEVGRRYQILSEREIGVSLITVGVNPDVESVTMLNVSTIRETVETFNFLQILRFSTVVDSVKSAERFLTAEIQSIQNPGETLKKKHLEIIKPYETYEEDVVDMDMIDTISESPYVKFIEKNIQSESIVSTRPVLTTSTQYLLPNNIITDLNYHYNGAYLDIDLDPGDSIVYVVDTSKFEPYGYLLIGDEIVFYTNKLSDRFLDVQRGQNNTSPQFWPSGTFLRQIPRPIEIVYAGVAGIESSANLISQKVDVQKTEIEVFYQYQIVQEDNFTENTITEILTTPPPSGISDGYANEILIQDPLIQRDDNLVDLLDLYGVEQRDGTEIYVLNNSSLAYQLNFPYLRGNVGPGIGNFNQILDDGVCDVSSISIGEVDTYFPTLRIIDFEERPQSSYTFLGQYFNLANASIQNPVTKTTSNGTIPSTVLVENTVNFPSEGYLFTSSGSVIQYTGITATSFTGCTLFRGPNLIATNDDLVPFSIS